MSGSFVKGCVVGLVCALVGGATVALAGSGIGGVFNLGVSNPVDAQTTLTGASPAAQLQVTNTNAVAGASGLGVSSASSTSTGFLNNTGGGTGLFAQTGGAGKAAVYARNTGGGPAGAFVVNAGVSPFTVSSTAKVANLNADRLDGLDSARFWNRGGNAGTSPGTDFLGTSDPKALELKVNGARALRIEPGSSPNLIGGYSGNSATPGVQGATIGGGGDAGSLQTVNGNYATIAGGRNNTASGAWSAVGGGETNTASGDASVVAGGNRNTASRQDSAVAGGETNTASGLWSAVAGGTENTASGDVSFVAGGEFNTASGDRSFAAGCGAQALNAGDFVWADSSPCILANFFSSTGDDQFLVRASGGAKIVRGANSFEASNAALQVEQAQSGDAVAWLRMASAASTFPVVSLIKQGAGTGDFLRCFDEAAGPVFSGKCHIDKDGTYTAGSDFAESLAARGGKARYSPGDVLRISRTRAATVELADRRFDRALIGVYSTRPAVLGADKGGITRVGKQDIPVAITGIVPVKVTAENGPIGPGDLLTSSSEPGRAMNAGGNPPPGTVLGKSLGFLTHGRGVIKMLVLPR